MPPAEKVSVLFVCLGNICRSPAAEGTFRHLVAEAGLDAHFDIDSAGTAGYHSGDAPNSNSTRVAARRGIKLSGRARQFVRADFERFQYIFAMDRSNYNDILDLAVTDKERSQVRLFRQFDADSADRDPDVPDPYYGGLDGFERVQSILLATGDRLLTYLADRHGLKRG